MSAAAATLRKDRSGDAFAPRAVPGRLPRCGSSPREVPLPPRAEATPSRPCVRLLRWWDGGRVLRLLPSRCGERLSRRPMSRKSSCELSNDRDSTVAAGRAGAGGGPWAELHCCLPWLRMLARWNDPLADSTHSCIRQLPLDQTMFPWCPVLETPAQAGTAQLRTARPHEPLQCPAAHIRTSGLEKMQLRATSQLVGARCQATRSGVGHRHGQIAATMPASC